MPNSIERPEPLIRPKFGMRSPTSAFKRDGDRPAPVWSIKGFALFEGLDESTCEHLEEVSRWARFAAHQPIFHRDDEQRDVFFVAEGRVRVVNYGSSGRQVNYSTLGPGEYFGELAVLGNQPRTAEVWAIENSLIAALPPEEMVAVLRQNSAIAMRMLERLAHVIFEADNRIGQLS